MKENSPFDSDTIEYIYELCHQFIEDSFSDEMMFFENYWEIYKEHLTKLVGKPAKTWRLKKIPKLKFPKTISMSGDADSITLITPKILAVISMCYARIIATKVHSQEEVEAIISKCVKKLPKEIREETVYYLTPKLQRDSRKVLNIPDDDGLNSKKIIRYIVYTHEDSEGKQLTTEEYFKVKRETEAQAQDYKFIIDEAKYECWFNGRKIEGKKKPVKPAWRAFIFLILNKTNSSVGYKDIFKFARIMEKFYEDDTSNTVQKWISLFRKYVDEDDDLRWFFTPVDEIGYKFQEGADFHFCVFRRLLEDAK